MFCEYNLKLFITCPYKLMNDGGEKVIEHDGGGEKVIERSLLYPYKNSVY